MIPYDIVLIPPRCLHHTILLRPNEEHERVVLWISESLIASFQSESADLTRIFQYCADNSNLLRLNRVVCRPLFGLLETVLDEQAHDYPGKDYYCKTLIAHFFLHLYRASADNTAMSKTAEIPAVIQDVVAYITQKRLTVAKVNLLKNIPASKIPDICGFTDYVSFYRAFRKEYGMSPSEFKKQSAAPPQFP